MIRQNTFNQFSVFSVRKQFKLQLKIDVFNKKKHRLLLSIIILEINGQSSHLCVRSALFF